MRNQSFLIPELRYILEPEGLTDVKANSKVPKDLLLMAPPY